MEVVEGSGNGDKYFVISKTNLTVRQGHSTSSAEIKKLSPGDRFTIVSPKETYSDSALTWIKIYIDTTHTGWVAEHVLPDKPITTFFPENIYSNISGNFNGVAKTENYIKKWGAPGKGSYTGTNQKIGNRFKVAIGPKILNPNYPDDGKVQMDDLKAFSKDITVVVAHIETGVSREVKCVVTDLKAHSYNTYPDGHGYVAGGTGNVDVENGLIQTGIAYPQSVNASKNLACSMVHMNGTVVEFCSAVINEFECSDYKLIKIISNESSQN